MGLSGKIMGLNDCRVCKGEPLRENHGIVQFDQLPEASWAGFWAPGASWAGFLLPSRCQGESREPQGKQTLQSVQLFNLINFLEPPGLDSRVMRFPGLDSGFLVAPGLDSSPESSPGGFRNPEANQIEQLN